MKKIAIFLMLGALTFTMTACSKKADEGEQQTETANTQEATQESTEPTSESGSEGSDLPGEDGWSAGMTQIRDAVVEELGENYWPNAPMPADFLESSYGISSDMYDDYMGEMPMISTNVDTLLVIKAKSDTVEEVEDLLLNYYDRQVNEAIQYPMNLGKVQAARVQRLGNYVCYVQLGGSAVDEDDIDYAIQMCQEQNDQVIEIISQLLEHE